MNETLRQLQHIIAEKQKTKPVMEDHNDPEATVQMIVEESEELRAAMLEVMVTNEVWTIASEIADVLYLSLYLCEICGLDATELVKLKMERNDQKYPAEALQEGDYTTITAKLKEDWAAKGGDKAWSESLLR